MLGLGAFAHVGHFQRRAGFPLDRLRVAMLVAAKIPGVRNALRAGGRHHDDARQRAEHRPAVGVGLQRRINGLRVVAHLEHNLHRPIGLRFARLPQQINHIILIDLREMQIFGLVGLVDFVEGVVLRRAQINFLIAALILNLGLEQELDCGQSLRHLDFINRLAIVKELEIGDFLGADHAVQIGRSDHQPHVFQRLERDRRAVEREPRADDQLSLAAGDQFLAIDVHRRRKLIVLRLLLKRVERRKVAQRKHDRLPPRLIREGGDDLAIFVGRIERAGEPERGLGGRLVLLVEHGEDLPGHTRADEELQLSFVDQGAARLAVADEIDDVHAAMVQRGELEMPPHAA